MIRQPLSLRFDDENLSYGAVVLRNIRVTSMSGSAHPTPWDALVDSGAGRSVVPLSLCKELGLSPFDLRKPFGFDLLHPALPGPFTTLNNS